MKNKTDNSDSYSFSESYEPNKDKRVYVDIYSSERKKAKRLVESSKKTIEKKIKI